MHLLKKIQSHLNLSCEDLTEKITTPSIQSVNHSIVPSSFPLVVESLQHTLFMLYLRDKIINVLSSVSVYQSIYLFF